MTKSTLDETLSYLALEISRRELEDLKPRIKTNRSEGCPLMFRYVDFVGYYKNYSFLYGTRENNFESIRGTDELNLFLDNKLSRDYSAVKKLYDVFLDQEQNALRRLVSDIEKMIEKKEFDMIVHGLFWRESKYVGEKLSFYNIGINLNDIPLLPKGKIDKPSLYLFAMNKDITEKLTDILYDAIDFFMTDFNTQETDLLKPEEENIKRVINDYYLLANK
jgi:hypothetical protein